MSIPLAALHFLLSSRAKLQYRAEISTFVHRVLASHQSSINKQLNGRVVTGAVLVTDEHPSKSDNKPHYTVDLYGIDNNKLDEPIGTAHVYTDGSTQVYDTPRAKAEASYNVRVASYKAAIQSGSGVV